MNWRKLCLQGSVCDSANKWKSCPLSMQADFIAESKEMSPLSDLADLPVPGLCVVRSGESRTCAALMAAARRREDEWS